MQATSDEGRGLCRHVKHDLGAHHSPDLFHVQHAASQATSAPLAAQVREAETALAAASQAVERQQASQAVERQQASQQVYLNCDPRPVGRPPTFERYRALAQAPAKAAQATLAGAGQSRHSRYQPELPSL